MQEYDQNTQQQKFMEKMMSSVAYRQGNARQFSPDKVVANPASPLAGKTIAFLGSSVTAGFAAKGKSFVDYLIARDGVQAIKSAVSGTTLAGQESGGYLARLYHDFPGNIQYDLFVCQLSTNDNRHGKQLGQITASYQQSGFDLGTTLGAIEEVCRYVQTHFACPLVFYTCLQNDPQHKYADLVSKLKMLQSKWHFTIIDLFHNWVLQRETKLLPNAMVDDVHPTQEGYLKLWLPIFERTLTVVLATQKEKGD